MNFIKLFSVFKFFLNSCKIYETIIDFVKFRFEFYETMFFVKFRIEFYVLSSVALLYFEFVSFVPFE